jgi:hypothetical protein
MSTASREAIGAGDGGAGRAADLSLPARIQRGLETLYRLEQTGAVDAFLIAEHERAQEELARRPREQLLLRQEGDEVALGLFLAPDALANLGQHDPTAGLHDGNFNDFCLVVEGVSHFLYVVRCASADRPVTALELELQAEVDKFACCALLDPRPDRVRALCKQLYELIAYHDDLDAEERHRYRVANDNARRFASSLASRFVETGRVEAMLTELRAFYRLDLAGKRAHIERVAA